MTRRRWLALALAALAAGGLGAWLSARRLAPGPAPDEAVGALFAQALPDADGAMQPLSQWRGRVLVVNFWATWCPPCVEEMPDLQEIRDEYRGRGVEVVGIGIDNADKIRAFRDRMQLRLPLLVAGASGSELGQALGNRVGALPYTALIDRNGRVVQRKLGQIKPAELRQWLDAQVN
jgi:thiol-disulfide isomerase/thioredoxin